MNAEEKKKEKERKKEREEDATAATRPPLLACPWTEYRRSEAFRPLTLIMRRLCVVLLPCISI